MHNEDEDNEATNIRRQILGDIAADLIDEAARRRIESVPDHLIEDFEQFIEEADPQQMYLLNLSQMFMEISLASNEKRLAYASVAIMAISGALDGVVAEGDWDTVLKYGELAWEDGQSLLNEVMADHVDKFVEE